MTSVDFVPRTYKEGEGEDRSLVLVYNSSHLAWHVKVTFKGPCRSGSIAPMAVRKEQFENLCLSIDLDHIKLLNDTVTELVIADQQDPTTKDPKWDMLNLKNRPNPEWKILSFKNRPDAESEYFSSVGHVCVYVREDPRRVGFPIYNTGVESVPTKELSEITKLEELAMGVHKAHIIGSEIVHVYKEIDRPMYSPGDSETLEQESRNLVSFCGVDGVVQLVAAVVSRNPYQSMSTNNSQDQTV